MEFHKDHCYMSLVEALREKYRRREESVDRMIENREAEKIFARADRIREKLRRQLLDGSFEKTPVECSLIETLVFPGYRIEKRRLSGAGGLWIPVTLYLPENREARHPAVVVTMGHWLHGKAREDNQRFCANLALRGAAAITFDPIFQGERCRYSEKQLEEMFGDIPEDMWMVGLHMQAGNLAYLLEKNVAALFVSEAMRVTDYLVSREDIDSGRILAAGQSGGGTQACYLGAVDDRIRGVIPIQCLSRLSITLEGGIGDCEQSFLGISADEGVEQGDLLWAVLPKPILHCAGRFDYFDVDGACSIEKEMQGVYRVLGQPGGYTLQLADCGHELTRQVRQQIYPWVCRQFGLPEIPEEQETAVLPPERLTCLRAEEKQIGPVDVYRQLLQTEKATRPGTPETAAGLLREKIGPLPETVRAEPLGESRMLLHMEEAQVFCTLKKGKRRKLLLYVGPEETGIPQTEASVVCVVPWAMESAYSKQRLGYDLETCMFNTAGVLGRNLCVERVRQILCALGYALEETGAEEILAVGQDVGSICVLLAACVSDVPMTVYLADCQLSLDALFDEEGYFIQETGILPGILKIADLPQLREMAKARVFCPRGADGSYQNREESLWKAVHNWLEEEPWKD